MIVVINRIPVKPDFAQRIEQGFAKNAPGLKGMTGFQGFRLLRPAPSNPSSPPDKVEQPYIVYVAWDTEDDYQAYVKSDQFKESHSNMADLADAFSGPPSLEMYEVAQEVDAPSADIPKPDGPQADNRRQT
ncbi:MAG: antibiotic biosynthesis monooxygenase [Chloroflexi bacterium]|nr:antibiotic biosynthesis monooxygenase [Chloroflexota bacterium]MCI0795768.1 antibiotic biosynthesis monooxygenase [Chloroflexota bacterium]MCI0868802.1 antibiotic biosynthesis monooxygenase [Chloroflexota bacterium]